MHSVTILCVRVNTQTHTLILACPAILLSVYLTLYLL